MKGIFFFALLLMFCINANSQSWNCDTEEPAEDFLFQTNQLNSNRSSLSNFNIRVYYHIVRRSDGKDGISQSLVNTGHNILNNDF